MDPHEWGNLELNKEELDVEVQEAALKSYKSHKENPEFNKDKAPMAKEKLNANDAY